MDTMLSLKKTGKNLLLPSLISPLQKMKKEEIKMGSFFVQWLKISRVIRMQRFFMKLLQF